eukprot:9232353-Pyramimonas_sp.AAC.1
MEYPRVVRNLKDGVSIWDASKLTLRGRRIRSYEHTVIHQMFSERLNNYTGHSTEGFAGEPFRADARERFGRRRVSLHGFICDVTLTLAIRAGGLSPNEKPTMIEIVDKLGAASAKAQGLGAVITDYCKMLASDHNLYVFAKHDHDRQVRTHLP